MGTLNAEVRRRNYESESTMAASLKTDQMDAEVLPLSLAPIKLSESASLAIAWFNSIDQLPPALFDSCFRIPLEGSWWYRALEKGCTEGQFKFEYAVVYADETPVAVAPTFLAKVPMELVAPEFLVRILKVGAKILPGIEFQKTLFVGSVCSDEGTIGTRPGVELAQVLPAITAAIEARGRELKVQVIVWKDFIDSDLPTLDGQLLKHDYFKMPSYPGAVVSLPPGNFDTYLKSITRSKRYKLKRKLKLSNEKGKLVSSVVQYPDAATLDEIFRLFWQTYEKGKTKFEQLTPAFFQEIAKNANTHFILLRNPDNRLVAFMLCFTMGKRVINKFIGLDYTLDGDWFLYFRLWEAAVSWVMSIGSGELQSGQTGYAAKLDIGHELIPLTNYCKNLNPLMNAIYKRVSASITWSSLDEDLAVHVKAHPATDDSSEK